MIRLRKREDDTPMTENHNQRRETEREEGWKRMIERTTEGGSTREHEHARAREGWKRMIERTTEGGSTREHEHARAQEGWKRMIERTTEGGRERGRSTKKKR